MGSRSEPDTVLSPLARSYLYELGRRRRWWSRARVEYALRDRGLPIYDAVLRYETLLSGFEAKGSHIGLTSLLNRPRPTADWTDDYRGQKLVAFAESWPNWFFADDQAAIYRLDQNGLAPFCESPLHLVERLALELETRDAPCVVAIGGVEGQRLAELLELERFDAASTATATWWLGRGNELVERRGSTTRAGLELYPADMTSATAALELLGTMGDGVSCVVRAMDESRVGLSTKPADEAPKAPKPRAKVRLPTSGSTVGTEGFLWVPKRGNPRIEQVELRDGRVAVRETFRQDRVNRIAYQTFADTLSDLLTPLAVAELRRRKARRDPEGVGPTSELSELLDRFGFASSPTLLETHERLGGLTFRGDDDLPDRAWFVGPLWNLRNHRKPADPGAPREELVPIAWGDTEDWYYLDSRGRIWTQDAIEMPNPVPISSSATCFLEQTLRRLMPKPELQLEVNGEHGTTLAAALSAERVAAASDEHERWWQGAKVTLCEPIDWRHVVAVGGEGVHDAPIPPRRERTDVWCDDMEAAKAAVNALRASVPGAVARSKHPDVKALLER